MYILCMMLYKFIKWNKTEHTGMRLLKNDLLIGK